MIMKTSKHAEIGFKNEKHCTVPKKHQEFDYWLRKQTGGVYWFRFCCKNWY